MAAVGFRITIDRPNSEVRQINITIYDVENGLNGIVDDTISYKIVRRNIMSAEEKVVAVISKKDSNMTIANNLVTIIYNDKPELYATEYLYRCDKVRDDSILVDYTETYAISTLPQRIDDFRINYNNSSYNDLGIPTELSLVWQSLDTAANNFDVIGYNIYYSLSPRGNGQWGEWNKLHGTSTDKTKDSVVKLIQPKDNEIKISTPQTTDKDNPMDIMFAIVAVTADDRKSQFSDIADCCLYNTVTQVIPSRIGGTVLLNITNAKTRPVTLEFEAGAFAKDTSVLLNRSQYNPSLGSAEDELYTYNILSNQPLAKWVTVKVDLELYVGQTYEVRIFNQNTKAWDSIPSTYNGDTNQIEIIMTTITSFVIIVKGADPKQKRILKPGEVFAKYTNKIIQQLPTWFKMRRDPLNSLGAQFLNITGLEYDNMEFILNYAYEQTRIDKADLSQTDIIYKAQLPNNVQAGDNVLVSADSFLLRYTPRLAEFFNIDSGLKPEINYDNPYMIDYQERYAYVRSPYNPDSDNKYGQVKITVYKKGDIAGINDPIYDSYVPLQLHHVWNFFDEFGMLLNTPRLLGEPNTEYKERILDVFKNISNASKDGLFNGIAREVGIRINKVWEDTTQDFFITDPMVTVNKIKVNGNYVDTDNIYFTSDGNIVIKNKNYQYANGSEVTYVSGIEMHTFHNRKDIRLYNQLYTIEDTATKLFKYYADLIKQKVPTDWGKFRWNEGYLDITDENMSGVGFLPVIYDGKYIGFKDIDEAGNKSGRLVKKSRSIAVKPIVIFPPIKYIPTGEPLPSGISIIPGDCTITGSYWSLTPTNPSYDPGTGPIAGTPQTMDDVKDYIGTTLTNYVATNGTTIDDLYTALRYGITDPGVTIDLGSETIVPATVGTDGYIRGSVIIHKTGEADQVIPINLTISGTMPDTHTAVGQIYSDKTGTYKYTQYIVYTDHDGNTGVVSQDYTYTVKDDVIDPPSYTPISTKPVQQSIIKVTYPIDAVHKQYRIGDSGEWLDYPIDGIIIKDNCYIYTRCDNVFGTWSKSTVIPITNIDNVPPTATVVPSTTLPTHDPVRVYCYPEPGSTIINNGGLPYYDFTSNGEYTFDIQDEAGNITHKTITINNIHPVPHVVINYSTLEITDGPVTATVISDLPITITNNGGSFSYNFISNGEFTFDYVDECGTPGTITAIVSNIYHAPVVAKILYSETSNTLNPVTATLVTDKPVTITNNGGSDKYVFTENGSFIFHFEDKWGTAYTAEAKVNNIMVLPKVSISYNITDPTHSPVTATVTSDRYIGITNNGGRNYYVFNTNGEFVFSYVDEYGNNGTIKATVNNIYPIPNVHIEYSDTTITDQDVVATVVSDLPITITNNGGLTTHTFANNGTFTFCYVDDIGATNSIVATVNNISRILHAVETPGRLDIYTYTDYVNVNFGGHTGEIDGDLINVTQDGTSVINAYQHDYDGVGKIISLNTTQDTVTFIVSDPANTSSYSNVSISSTDGDLMITNNINFKKTDTFMVVVHNRNISHYVPPLTITQLKSMSYAPFDCYVYMGHQDEFNNIKIYLGKDAITTKTIAMTPNLNPNNIIDIYDQTGKRLYKNVNPDLDGQSIIIDAGYGFPTIYYIVPSRDNGLIRYGCEVGVFIQPAPPSTYTGMMFENQADIPYGSVFRIKIDLKSPY